MTPFGIWIAALKQWKGHSTMKKENKYTRFMQLLPVAAITGALIPTGFVLAQSAAETPTRQVYTAQLNPLNSSLSSSHANARIIVEGNRAGVYIEGSGFTPNTVHMQHIHIGTACPTQAADKNADGIIDALESNAVTGPAAVPLSLNPVRSIVEGITTPGTSPSSFGNLATQSPYPASSMDGKFTYIASIPLNALQRALHQEIGMMPVPPPTPTEPSPPSSPAPITPPSSGISLERKVIVIHGVGSQASLPNTVQSLPGVSSTQSIPIACGQLMIATD